jgi:predicted acylesterase/phospholipase RssA
MSVLYTCIASGGIRGYFSYRILRYISKTIGSYSQGKHGGFIGVSAGAIIAALCALDLFNELTDDKCQTLLKNVLSLSWPHSLKSSRKYDILYDLFGDRLMGEAIVPLYIIATTTNGHPTVFDSTDSKYASLRIVDIVHASSAIPIIMKPVKVGKSMYIDGGVTSASPCTLGYFIAKSRGIQESNIHILSIGTNINTTIRQSNDDTTLKKSSVRQKIMQNVSLFSFQNISTYFGSSDILYNTFVQHLLQKQYLKIHSVNIQCDPLDINHIDILYKHASLIYLQNVFQIFLFLQSFVYKQIH